MAATERQERHAHGAQAMVAAAAEIQHGLENPTLAGMVVVVAFLAAAAVALVLAANSGRKAHSVLAVVAKSAFGTGRRNHANTYH